MLCSHSLVFFIQQIYNSVVSGFVGLIITADIYWCEVMQVLRNGTVERKESHLVKSWI